MVSRSPRWARTSAVLLGGVLAALPTTSSAVPTRTARPVVIAVVGEAGINVLHSDFRARDGRAAAPPAGMPKATSIVLPSRGSFASRLAAAEAGPLGHLAEDHLYSVAGTRVVGVYVAHDGAQPPTTHDLLADRLHGTGVASAAAGLTYGTDPDALLVFVTPDSPEAWHWVADQSWIDVATDSSINVADTSHLGDGQPSSTVCGAEAGITQMTASGRMVFASSGNNEQIGLVSAPNGLPSVYQVGGVDASGQPWIGVHPDESDPSFATGQVTRPYQTGDLYSFPAASSDSLTGSMHFGGTSGATPRTAGRAAALISYARSLLNSPPRQPAGLLAALGPRGRRPVRGPLADGALSGRELTDLLHHTATPSLPATPGRYFVEGFGATSARTTVFAEGVLAGTAVEPSRPDEERANDVTTQARAALFASPRCS